MKIEEIQKELNRLQGELDKLKRKNLYIPQPGEIVEISCDEKNWHVRIFVKYDKNLVNPFVCVNGDGNEARYKDGEQYKTTSWGLCRRLNGEIVEFGCDKPKKPDYTNLLPYGYEFCDALGEIYSDLHLVAPKIRKTYRPIREAVASKQNPYAVDWSNAPEWADSHAFDQDGTGYWYGSTIGRWGWTPFAAKSNLTLPSGLDWKQSKTLRPIQ